MFIINFRYKKDLSIVDQYLASHRSFLEEGYQKNFFVASGPKNPRIGGIIISQLTDRKQLEEILQKDPFYLFDIAEYEVIEFTPVKHHPDFACFIKQ